MDIVCQTVDLYDIDSYVMMKGQHDLYIIHGLAILPYFLDYLMNEHSFGTCVGMPQPLT